ncbi:DEAD/DEAH box helicase [Alicyclobacillus tolerans]|uniref:DEAD/DEAH box helicase n=1 Tax=Alicyclobacillus tolerans TaxID=90970 RepID=UPI003B80F4E6
MTQIATDGLSWKLYANPVTYLCGSNIQKPGSVVWRDELTGISHSCTLDDYLNTKERDDSWIDACLQLAESLLKDEEVCAFAVPVTASLLDTFQLARQIAARDDAVPNLYLQGQPFVGLWLPTWRNPVARSIRRRIISSVAVLMESSQPLVDAMQLVDTVLLEIIRWFIQKFATGVAETPNAANRTYNYRVLYRGEQEILNAWQEALSQPYQKLFAADGWLLCRALRQEIEGSAWGTDELGDTSGSAFYRLGFALRPPVAPSDIWQLQFEWVHRFWPEERVSMSELYTSQKREGLFGKDYLQHPETWVWQQLYQAAQIDPAIAKSLSEAVPTCAEIASQYLLEWIDQILPALRSAGFPVRVEGLAEIAKDIQIRVQVQSSVKKKTGRVTGGSTKSVVPALPLVEFDWMVVIDNKVISRKEFMNLVEEKKSLLQLQGVWKIIPIEEILERIRLAGLETDGKETASTLQMAQAALLQDSLSDEQIQFEFEFAEGASTASRILKMLVQAGDPPLLPTPKSFAGRLRTYQIKGFSWLCYLRNIPCGACLADDMGLGKTIQVIAYLQHIAESGDSQGIHLLVCPTSLLQNWKSELRRFAPGFQFYIHHGPTRREHLDASELQKQGIQMVITTYTVLVRDQAEFENISWDSVILDEAQNIKNLHTKQAQAAARLHAYHRIALTGTPVENRLEELWSLFSFINPGYLGSRHWFLQQFDFSVQANEANEKHPAAVRLRRLLSPVLLRRRKSDPAIREELPMKWESVEYALLTTEQAALYQAVIDQLFGRLPSAAGMSRRGQILASLVRLKQICDHPALVLGGAVDVKRSGKLKLLMERLQEVAEESEAALIFTQFREMGELLTTAIEQQFGKRPFFLHGGLNARMRGEMVEQYQSGRSVSPFFILSLRAGGVGLNLTRANHVFHFDRWWNPAVEDQATDRVHRMGQTRDVQVHKLVSAGTLEERIDEMLSKKRGLSQAIVGGSEHWLTEMGNQELQELFRLDNSLVWGDED